MAAVIPFILKSVLGGLFGSLAKKGLTFIANKLTGKGLCIQGGSLMAPREIREYSKKDVNRMINQVIDDSHNELIGMGIRVRKKELNAYKKDLRNAFYDGTPLPLGNFQ